MRLDESNISCGVTELSGLRHNPLALCQFVLEKHKRNVKGEAWVDDFVFVMFSDIANRYGDALCNFIVDNKLGVIHRTCSRSNPNTDSLIKVFVWQPIWSRLEKIA